MKLVDCVIVGGSYGGLSAALCLGRSLRQTVVIDSGLPCNRYTPHSQNFLTQDGVAPSKIVSIGKQQILDKYSSTVSFQDGRVVAVKKEEAKDATLFHVETASGDKMNTKSMIFASGITDLIPKDIPGFQECWGTSVVHCPYCHGFEYRNEPTALYMPKAKLMHMLPLVRNLSMDVTVISNEAFEEEELELFNKNGVKLLSSPIKEIIHKDGHLSSILLQDGTAVPTKAMYAGLPFELNVKDILEDLGVTLQEESGLIEVDAFQKTNVEGVLAVGDATTHFRTVANAVNGGNKAGAVVNMELCQAEFA